MKRRIAMLLCALMTLTFAACSPRQEELIEPIEFYYLQVQPAEQILHGTADSVITPESREGHQISEDLDAVLTLYFSGPVADYCRSPFPAGTKLVAWTADGSTLTLTLSDHVTALTGIDLTLACACLTKTCLALRDFETVIIQADSTTMDGKASVTMNETTLLMLDDTITGNETTSK